MLHLIAGEKFCPSPGEIFLAGCVAPDAVDRWRRKNVYHFRDLDERERFAALENLARKTELDDPFALGSLLHLYLDFRWDIKMRDPYIAKSGEDWHPPYKREIDKSSRYAYHKHPTAPALWALVDSCPIDSYGEIPGASSAELRALIERNKSWHEESFAEPSSEFPPEMVEEFLKEAARDFREFVNNL